MKLVAITWFLWGRIISVCSSFDIGNSPVRSSSICKISNCWVDPRRKSMEAVIIPLSLSLIQTLKLVDYNSEALSDNLVSLGWNYFGLFIFRHWEFASSVQFDLQNF